jgi:glycerol uptake facilitator-like aquaporin
LKLPYVTNLECFFSEFTATALLVMGIFALFDQATHGTHLGIVPIGIFILFTGIAVAFGAQTSFAANPARDFGPRVFTAMVGYGRQVFTFRKYAYISSVSRLYEGVLMLRAIAGTFSTLLSSGVSQEGCWALRYTTSSFMVTG